MPFVEWTATIRVADLFLVVLNNFQLTGNVSPDCAVYCVLCLCAGFRASRTDIEVVDVTLPSHEGY